MSIPTACSYSGTEPDPVSRDPSPAGDGRPMDRTGGMENAHDTLAPECTGPEARFPHRLGRHRTPPIRSTGTLVCTLEHDVHG